MSDSDPLDCSPPGFSVHGISPGKNTGVGCRALLQGIFLTQGSNLCLFCLLHWQVGSLSLAPLGKPYAITVSFPGGPTGKISACNAGVPGSIPRPGRSPGEGTDSPLHYPWASLVAQMVKNPPAMWETRVRSLGWEDTLEEGMATHSQYSCLENPHGQRSAALSLWS